MSNCILFIDGENFLHKVEEVIGKEQAVRDSNRIVSIDLDKLFNLPLKGLRITRKIFYASRLHLHPETKRKSEQLIRLQRKLRNNLVKLGYEFIIAGNVRAQKVNGKIIFREKGVDVKIAVDMVSLACDKKLATAILCSSDSDLQPAISEVKNRNVEVVYLGFENNPNKGLTYTTNRTILLRNSEVLASLSQRKKA
ncbi:hypothetical protein A3J19_03990 [Candidatus Daviesbacteria bacterium RIFCSPLOWO2_02_FULL_41_8]|uniref:NYN domain-containing protein n=3 Tax=Candidatus Daviesiibacteriota TaxID=1752718 RepID=A0A1F5NLG3_9BACT|nr:MAG: hypothetical protein A2871_03990 [Candidatus Daviesbacteria bacterium RIFCSPHIGHO2_01_FULL_41_23]OGE33872.1 MAG: hypothetical protein A3D83_00500 [Candidatus Daviesbacteria bacterium RIFCSPHIGHO2_02_FULL_41_10]OGE62297.1 MAG: hypothetical protein A2967_02480 [Candidatus Daviesbacteria bacterium RIFCSPLOWO2_01_FULL_41_32]OGE78393.1 MAG: hypothetical protein A3J19_03990 [Candidatus Daviesbacteria bacterium RIFCSPLOWO2_02_FULL_41_8]